jgi:hypothetical protein
LQLKQPGCDDVPPLAVAAALGAENVLVTVQTGQTRAAVLTVPVAEIVTEARFCCRTDQSVTHAAKGHGQQRPPSGTAAMRASRILSQDR